MLRILLVSLFASFIKLATCEESLLWHSSDGNLTLIAPNYLPESKKENRRLPIIVEGSNFK